MNLLLLYPYSKEAKDVETHLWMQTSYQIISLYKQRILALDRKVFPPAPARNGPRQDHGGAGQVEYRKALNKFRQFLAEEEKLYMKLLVRFRKQFELDEVQPALVKSDILSSTDAESQAADTGRSNFPAERELAPPSPSQREEKILICSKLLVYLGDIARYREQYNDGGGRPRAGHEDGQAKKAGRGGKKGEPLPRARNYSRAQTFYEQSRLLVPDDGNASHQLAILSGYQKDSFSSLLHYYRALCVRTPYGTASDNLITVLKKGLEHFRAKRDRPNEVQFQQVDRFKDGVVALHGLWFLDKDE